MQRLEKRLLSVPISAATGEVKLSQRCPGILWRKGEKSAGHEGPPACNGWRGGNQATQGLLRGFLRVKGIGNSVPSKFASVTGFGLPRGAT